MHFGCPSNSATNPNRPNRPIGQPDRRGPSTIRPTHRPIAPPRRAPHPHPTLALGLRILGAQGPPPGPCFPVFVFSRPPACSESPGPALTERSKTLRPRPRPRRAACTRRTWTSPRVPSQRPRSTTPSLTRSWRCRDLVWTCRLGVWERRGRGRGRGRQRGLVLVFYLFFDFFSGEFYGTVSVLCFTDFILFSCTFYAGFSAEFYVFPY